MLVPGHVVALYVATGGQHGPALGCDEKEVVLLVYVIIDVATNSIVGIKQHLVRPEAPLIFNSSSNNSTGGIVSELQNQANNHNTSNSQSPTPSLDASSVGGDSSSVLGGGNNNNNTESPLTEALVGQILHSGRPLREVLDEFDSYIRSLSIDPSSPTVRLVTDGQLPLRQCLHPEACTKDIKLPAYYWRFCDLRKEYARCRSGDLSQALIAINDAKKLQSLAPSTPLPNSINEMFTELELKPTTNPTSTIATTEAAAAADSEFYCRESRDMVSVVQALLKAGHKFDCIEQINLSLEPGICSIDDEIDGNCIVRARGLPWQSSDQDIAKFFRGLNVAKGGVALCLSPQGRRNGEALVRFVSQEHRDMALKRHRHHIANRYIEVYPASGNDFLSVAGGASNEAQSFLSKGAQVIIRMRGLPYDCTAKQVLEFFSNGENPCNVLDGVDGVLFVKKPDGRATGDAFVLFANESDAPHALARHRESIGQRYIELFRSTTAEVQQVLNRSLDPKTYEPPPPPLISQLPTMQMPLLPQTPFQHVITSGTSKDCIRLRGLPFDAKVENILQFLDDFAKNIVFQGVHMVYNAQGAPSGEAFIQMDSEASAYSSAQKKHHKYMMSGKKQRYIEVFQCSGDDMNMVLTGGIHSPVNSKPPLLSPGYSYPFGLYSQFAPAAAILSPRGHPAAYYPQPILYYYPSPPVSPNGYFAPHPHASNPHLNHNGLNSPQPGLFPLEFMPPPGAAMHNPQFSPRHPPQHLQPHQNGALISGPSAHPHHHPHMPFNSHHHHHHQQQPQAQQQHLQHPHSHLNATMLDMNNNSMHMFNQPSLLLAATPLNPSLGGGGGAPHLSPTSPLQVSSSSASSEAGPADSSESTTPTSGSCSGESTLSSNSDSAQASHSSQPFLLTNGTGGGGSQSQQTFYHQNGIIATQLAEDCQTKMGPALGNSQYVSLFIV